MKETSKAMRRRQKDTTFPWGELFTGDICDVGSGDDPLRLEMLQFYASNRLPRITCIDAPDGAGDDLKRFVGDEKFDTIHASNVLEHAIDPKVMLQSWIDCLKPGGHIIATCPDWELYEKSTWPSKWNAGHRSAWTMKDGLKSNAPTWIKLPEWLNQFGCQILRCELVLTNYNYQLGPDVDQTLPPDGAEVCIEFVLKRITQ